MHKLTESLLRDENWYQWRLQVIGWCTSKFELTDITCMVKFRCTIVIRYLQTLMERHTKVGLRVTCQGLNYHQLPVYQYTDIKCTNWEYVCLMVKMHAHKGCRSLAYMGRFSECLNDTMHCERKVLSDIYGTEYQGKTEAHDENQKCCIHMHTK